MLKTIALLTPVYITGFWATVLFLTSRPSRNQAKFFLGFFMMSLLLVFIGLFFYITEDYISFAHFRPVYNFAVFMIFPLYYFFIRLLTLDVTPDFSYLWHILPAIFFAVLAFGVNKYYYYLGYQNSMPDISDKISFRDFHESPGLFYIVFIMARKVLLAFQIIYYTVKGIRLINFHHQRILNFYSNESGKNVNWLQIMYYSMVLSSLLSFAYNYFGKSMLQHNLGYLLISSLLYSTILFLIGFLGSRQDQVIKEIAVDQIDETNDSYIETWQEKELKENLENLFRKKKIHLNSELTIWDVSGELITNRTYISNFINKHYGINFSRFVNQYRVEEAKAMMEEIDSRKFTLETIGEKCGFGSLNNFIRVFQSFEGTTPGFFRVNQKSKD